MCLSLQAFALFLSITGLTYTQNGPLITVHSEQPALYLITDGAFCHLQGVRA